MAYDFIEHSKQIEGQLVQAGRNEAAERLVDARLGGTTSGEILMALRHVLREVLASPDLPDSVGIECTRLIDEIDRSGI